MEVEFTATIVIPLVALLVSFGSAFWAYRSYAVAKKQFDLISKKVGMVTDPALMTDILPVWYVERMAQDHWYFGLMLRSGDILAISRILGVSDDSQWMEVELLSTEEFSDDEYMGKKLIKGLPDREAASVRIDQVQTAFELANT